LRRVESFDADLRLFELAEALGYDKIWIAEHLFSTYGVVTSTQVYAAAIAQRTRRVRIGTAVVVVPFNHPLRTASDFALIDVLSHGRLDFGAGRAYQPHEFRGLGVPMDQSRAMFAEGLEIVLKAWTEERIMYQGKYWTIPDPVEVLRWRGTASPSTLSRPPPSTRRSSGRSSRPSRSSAARRRIRWGGSGSRRTSPPPWPSSPRRARRTSPDRS
jgi:alkanesulfonate monooxygenase SsuD/methylene tetrahydromethanopterin reductase-like flavin-dependent oxidoreductase (luciferase family)